MANIFLFKINNRSTRKRYELCSKFAIKTPEWRSVSIANFEHIWHFFSVRNTSMYFLTFDLHAFVEHAFVCCVHKKECKTIFGEKSSRLLELWEVAILKNFFEKHLQHSPFDNLTDPEDTNLLKRGI